MFGVFSKIVRIPKKTVFFLVSLLALMGPAASLAAYKLDVGDSLKVQVFGEPDLTLEIVLDETGAFDFPFVGKITAVGRTVDQLENVIDAGLRGDYLIDPEVNVSVNKYRNFFIKGEVKNPGGYPYQPGLTVIQAVTLAGGFTERASKDKLIVQRKGQSQPYRVRANSSLGPGDILTVEQSLF